jgi:monothiol glutaredoxin
MKKALSISCLFLPPVAVAGFTTQQVRTFVQSRPSREASSASTFSSALHLSAVDDESFLQETPDATQERIQALVDEHPVLLFMKGSKLFPQCGFSNTATQILSSFGIDFYTVDVLSDQNIREGVKVYSNWPTIPQLYVCGEFIGGSDIMIEMYQSGELGEMIEKAKADMM